MTHAYTESSARDALPRDDGSHVVVATPRTRAATRVLFVDWLRLVAAFQMLQGHTIAALLAPSYRVGNWYALWSAARGLTSVAFLFAAGMAFYIATARDYAGHRQSRAAVAHRLRRGVGLIVLGYILHTPYLPALWHGSPALAEAALQRWIAVDVLQCIGVGLLCLEVMVLLLPTSGRFAIAAGALSVTSFVLTPLATHASLPALPPWIAAYATPSYGSLFPLLPWSGHMFAGVACAALVSRNRDRAGMRLAIVALALLALSMLLRTGHAAPVLYDHTFRLGWVVLGSALLARSARRATRTAPWLQILAGETLFLYAFHVLLVYADGVGLAGRIGPTLSAAAACGAAAAVVSGSCIAALAYHGLKAVGRGAQEPSSRLAGAGRTR